MYLNYVIWNATPQIIDLGKFEIRYYSLLFALGFIAGYFILLKIFNKQGIKVEFLDKLTIYMVLSTIIGARLGHCLFYEFDYYIRHPLEIILPWRGTLGKDFEFTGFQGLASHGAAVGIMLGLYLLSRKTKTSFLWILDMIVIVTALAGSLIRTGNLMNSEIYGNPTHNNKGFIYTNDFSNLLEKKHEGVITNVTYDKNEPSENWSQDGVPITVNLEFHRKIKDEKIVKQFGETLLSEYLTRYNLDNNVYLPPGDSIAYTIEHKNNHFVLKAGIGGTPRYPTQIYEALSYLLIFIILFVTYILLKDRLKNGFIFGSFLFFVFTARFIIEFLKENQEAFEDSMSLNMGQILSIPFIATGLILIFRKWPKKKTGYETPPSS